MNFNEFDIAYFKALLMFVFCFTLLCLYISEKITNIRLKKWKNEEHITRKKNERI